MLSYLCLIAAAATSDLPSSGHNLVYSNLHEAVLMLNGDGEGQQASVWQWTGKEWKVIASNGPSPRSLAAVGFDTDKKLLMMHGGAVRKGNEWSVVSSTMSWDGKEWKEASTSGPAPRDHHCMVYDAARKQMVLFGGGNAKPTGESAFYGDTWTWNGEKWRLAATSGPPPRVHHSMAYDPVRQKVVMAGGFGAGGRLDARTWEWDGAKWSAACESGPVVRSSARMAYSEKLQATVMFGGSNERDRLNDTWAWDGATWKQLTGPAPTSRCVHAMAYDQKLGVIVMHGGDDGGPLRDTWLLGKTWAKP